MLTQTVIIASIARQTTSCRVDVSEKTATARGPQDSPGRWPSTTVAVPSFTEVSRSAGAPRFQRFLSGLHTSCRVLAGPGGPQAGEAVLDLSQGGGYVVLGRRVNGFPPTPGQAGRCRLLAAGGRFGSSACLSCSPPFYSDAPGPGGSDAVMRRRGKTSGIS